MAVFASAPAIVNCAEEIIHNPVAEFSGIDKITGRIITFDVYINETVQFGALQVTPRICNSRPETETPKTTSFVEVDEITLDRKIRRIFTGWMFADSPGLNAVEHAVYDVWLKSCKAENRCSGSCEKLNHSPGYEEKRASFSALRPAVFHILSLRYFQCAEPRQMGGEKLRVQKLNCRARSRSTRCTRQTFDASVIRGKHAFAKKSASKRNAVKAADEDCLQNRPRPCGSGRA